MLELTRLAIFIEFCRESIALQNTLYPSSRVLNPKKCIHIDSVFRADVKYDIYLQSNMYYSARKPSNIFKKGHFSSFFVLHFVRLKTREFGYSVFCRAIDSLQNSING
jgi:hypothetical protein